LLERWIVKRRIDVRWLVIIASAVLGAVFGLLLLRATGWFL